MITIGRTRMFSFAVLLALSLFLPGMRIVCAETNSGNPQSRPSSPEGTIQEFYTFHFSHDMGFTVDAVQQRSSWLSPALLEDCKKYFAVPGNPDEAPVINGDPFTNSQEYPQSFEAGKSTVSGESATIPLKLVWKEGPPRSVTVVLKQVGGKWMIDDIRYPEGESFRSLLQSN